METDGSGTNILNHSRLLTPDVDGHEVLGKRRRGENGRPDREPQSIEEMPLKGPGRGAGSRGPSGALPWSTSNASLADILNHGSRHPPPRLLRKPVVDPLDVEIHPEHLLVGQRRPALALHQRPVLTCDGAFERIEIA